MLFELDKLEQGEGFKFFESRITEKGDVIYDDPKEDAATFYIRALGPKVEEFLAKRKRRFDFVLNPSTRAMERVGYFEEQPREEAQKQSYDLWDYAITGWDEKALDAKGQPIPVTRENKLKLMKLAVFDRFVARCLQLIASAGVKAQEEAEKN